MLPLTIKTTRLVFQLWKQALCFQDDRMSNLARAFMRSAVSKPSEKPLYASFRYERYSSAFCLGSCRSYMDKRSFSQATLIFVQEPAEDPFGSIVPLDPSVA